MPFDLDFTESILYKRGEARGGTIGEARGAALGEARMLAIILETRFGPLPESIQQRVAEAPRHQLEQWAIRAAHRGSLNDLFLE